MARYLTLSRAARLVGIKRGALQKKIRAGDLSTFEGMLELDELLRVYPNVKLEDSAMIERIDRFVENAWAKVARSNAILPDAQTLLTRVSILSQELAVARAEVNRYATLMDDLKPRVAGLDEKADKDSEASVHNFKSWFLHALEGRTSDTDLPARLLAREAFLRVMAAHVRVMPSGHEYFVEGQDNLLAAGLRSGISLPYGCNNASCGRCKVRLLTGKVRQLREPGYRLGDDEVREGQILSCCCAAVTDIVVEAAEAGGSEDIPAQKITTRIQKITRYGDTLVLQARFGDGERLHFLAGQYAQVQLADGSSTDSAIASCPCDERSLEFHLTALSNPGFWRYATEQMAVGEDLMVHGPKGDFVLNAGSARPLVFMAIDSGFGAIKSLIEHAMALDAVESMHLYRAASSTDGIYQDNLCRAWADALDEFSYTALQIAAGDEGLHALVDTIAADYPSLAEYDVYLCAPQGQLQRLGIELENRTGAVDQRVNIEPIRIS